MALGVAKLEKAYRRNPQAPLFAHLAEIYLKKGDVPRALTLCLSGCKLFPDYPTGHLILSRCYEVQGDLEGARKALLRGLLLDPVNPSGFGRLARLCHQLGDLPMALKSMQKAANLDAFSEAAQEKVQSLEQELRNHEDDNGSVAEAVGTAPESEQGQDSVSASSGEVAEIQATSPVGEEESQDSEPGGAEPAADEPFGRIYEAPEPEATSGHADDPAKSMKSADEIQDDIDAFFDTMGAGPAAPPSMDTTIADPASTEGGRDPDSTEDVEETATLESVALESSPDLLSLSVEPTRDIPADALDSGAETLATLMAPTVAADEETAETDTEAGADPPADLTAPATDNETNALFVLSAGGAVDPSATEESDPVVDSFITLSDASSSDASLASMESEEVDAPADPMLFLDGNSTRPPESRVADLDGTAPAPSSPPDESEDLGPDREESDRGDIASLAPGEDREFVRLFEEINEHGSEQPEISGEGNPDETAPKEMSIATATLAALYQQQGLVEQAVGIYKRLLEQEPENAEFRRKIQELKG